MRCPTSPVLTGCLVLTVAGCARDSIEPVDDALGSPTTGSTGNSGGSGTATTSGGVTTSGFTSATVTAGSVTDSSPPATDTTSSAGGLDTNGSSGAMDTGAEGSGGDAGTDTSGKGDAEAGDPTGAVLGACCEPLDDGEVGCEDPAIETCVCDAMPTCCDTAWDQACADAVEGLACGVCS